MFSFNFVSLNDCGQGKWKLVKYSLHLSEMHTFLDMVKFKKNLY